MYVHYVTRQMGITQIQKYLYTLNRENAEQINNHWYFMQFQQYFVKINATHILVLYELSLWLSTKWLHKTFSSVRFTTIIFHTTAHIGGV